MVKINQQRKNIIISRRELIEEERQEKRNLLLDNIKVIDSRPDMIKNTTDYGAFVGVDRLDDFLHITDMSSGRISYPNDVVTRRQDVNVMVIGIDQEKARFSLGPRQTVANSWDNIEQRSPIGSEIHGKIASMTPYGHLWKLHMASRD
jgi:small subunit ribosomal protein S1